MIRTLIRVLWLGLARDRISLAFLFVLPIAFFSVFAVIFGGMGGGGGGGGGGGLPGSGKAIEVIAVDLDNSEISQRFLMQFSAQDGIDLLLVHPATDSDDPTSTTPYTREEAIDLVFQPGKGPAAAVIIPEGFGTTFGNFGGELPQLELIFDATNPFANYACSGMLQAASFQTAPDILMERGMSQLDQLDGFDAAITDSQREAFDFLRPFLRGDKPWTELDGSSPSDESSDPEGSSPAAFQGMIEINSKNARQVVMDEGSPLAEDGTKSKHQKTPMMPYYAAGIGVMFLLFSMVAAAGSMLKEVETGALERVLSSHVTMTQLLLSKWAFYTIVGSLQLFVMFVWGSILFGIDLWTMNHLVGFWVMTLITAAAASGFGMMMATLCRTRGQLDGISTIVILMMSAVGGSMIPRVFMPDFMQSLSQFTFNGQALNGYLGVFWNEQPGESVVAVITRIAPSAGVLAVMTIAFFTISRLLARRWDAV